MRASDEILLEMRSVVEQGKELCREYQRLEQIFELLKTELDDAKLARPCPSRKAMPTSGEDYSG
jgi:hypothetical protein